jgi:hypothetical protein
VSDRLRKFEMGKVPGFGAAHRSRLGRFGHARSSTGKRFRDLPITAGKPASQSDTRKSPSCDYHQLDFVFETFALLLWAFKWPMTVTCLRLLLPCHAFRSAAFRSS